VFYVSHGSKAKFCSNRCRGISRTGLTGDSNFNWKGGKSQTRSNTRAAKQWRKLSLERENNHCEACGIAAGMCKCCNQVVDLHVHHIKAWAKHPELRYEFSNAKVLCTTCHREIHKSP